MARSFLLALLPLAAVVGWYCWRSAAPAGDAPRAAATRADAPQAPAAFGAAPMQPAADVTATAHGAAAEAVTPVAAAPALAPPHATAPGATTSDATPVWPIAAASTHAAGSEAPATPAVPVTLAFRALWYLGADPAAEVTWSRAINDPLLPAGVRSDLILDMIDEGYTDNSHPGPRDLPLILLRLQIIERHAPLAMDEVNRKAFAEIYRDLLDLYIRLGGDARRKEVR